MASEAEWRISCPGKVNCIIVYSKKIAGLLSGSCGWHKDHPFFSGCEVSLTSMTMSRVAKVNGGSLLKMEESSTCNCADRFQCRAS